MISVFLDHERDHEEASPGSNEREIRLRERQHKEEVLFLRLLQKSHLLHRGTDSFQDLGEGVLGGYWILFIRIRDTYCEFIWKITN